MKQIRKYKALIGALFIACFFSVFAVKSFHHLEAHGSDFSCSAHEGIHFHGGHAESTCHICDFFFSPFHDRAVQQEVSESCFSNTIVSILPRTLTAQFVSFFYSLRAPPL